MLWHPKTLQNLAMYNVFFIFGRFSIAGKLPKWPKIPFQYPLALRHPKILEKCRKHHRILVSVRNRFWPPPAKADIATAILTNVIEHLVLLFCPPISTPSPPKRCGRIYGALRHHMASIFSDQVHPTGIRSLPAAASQLPHPQHDPGGNPRSAVAGTFSLQTVSRKSQGENSGIPEILFSSSVQSSWIPAQLSLRDLSKKDVRFERGRSWLVNHGGYLDFHPLWFTYLKRANW